MPAIVGYSDRGTLNTDSLPENLKSFLAAYKATVEAVEKGDSSAVKNVKAAMKRVAGSYTPVAPLLGGIVWDQDAPFNKLCPKYDGAHTAVTGCVATAMAQIMRYWKYPSSLLEDIPAYTSQRYNIPIESIQKGIGYNWDNMLENYWKGYTPEQAVAVATLMQHVGASVKMDYGESSGAISENVASALTQYFGYDKNIIKSLRRAYYDWEDWNKILQDELGKKRPIYYSGATDFGGHAFVCDGMDADGYYHINWGWGGTSNDYFDITILNPDAIGADASTSTNGYNNNNLAIIGIVPDESQDKQPSFVFDKFSVTLLPSYNAKRLSASDSFSGTAVYELTSLDKDLQALFSIGIKDEKGDFVPISSERKELCIKKNEKQEINITFNYPLPVGEYNIYAIQSTDNGKTWEKCYGNQCMVYVSDTELLSYIYEECTLDNMEYLVDIFHKEAYANHFLGGKTEVVIPASITYNDKKYAITKISKNCFKNSPSLLRVDIPEGVTELGDFCFYNCPSLTSISIPSTICKLGGGCFCRCTNWEGNIVIPEGVTVIPDVCFSNCSSLTSISIPSTVRELGMDCFNYCSNLKEVAIPEGVTKISNGCFNGCSSLASISLPSTISELGDFCFNNCSSLKEVAIPEGGTKIPNYCFESCSSLASISLPSTTRELGEFCFYNCSNLKEVAIPEGVTKIPEWCFCGCSSLTSISLPSTLRELGELCFRGCSNWKGEVVIPEGVTKIPEWCFSGCSSLTSISLPSTLRELGELCFKGCSNWKGEVVIPEGVTKIPNSCFYGCSSLTSICLPSTIQALGESCFGWCTSIKNISLPSTLEEISDRCFYNCNSLTNMNIPSSVKKFGEESFFRCHNWTGDLVIPEGTTQIPRSCFEGCHALSSISLPSTLQQLDSCSIVCSARMKEMKLKLADVPENFADAINHGEWRGWPGYYSQASTKNFLTLYVPASSVEAYKQEVGQYFKAILPLAETGINQPSLDGIAISANHGNIVISGLTDGTPVKLYAVDGKYIGESIANQGSASFNCGNENMVIAKIGSKSMKIAVNR